jgi:crotonobetainyl-CoA:carnitine CoA-transferase CaiB-like acyl-CoA transferase
MAPDDVTGESLPLRGVRVIDAASNIAAPWTSAVLADLGADVIRVEPPNGDDSRRMAPTIGERSAYFHVVNRGKRTVRLDLTQAADRDRLDALVAEADVFVTNLRPASLDRHQLSAADLCARHPRLIHASLTGYGDTGTERDSPGYDAVLQARTGIAAVTGMPDGSPVRAGVSILDIGAGTWLALGVLAALLERARTGRGGPVSTSLFETGASWVSYHVAAHQVTGAPSGRHGSRHPAFSPYGILGTASGGLCVGVGSDGLFKRLCDAIGRPDLVDDPRAVTNAARVEHRSWLEAEIEQALSVAGAEEWALRLRQAGVPAEPVRLPEDLLTDPQARALEVFGDLDVGAAEPLRVPRLPLTFGGKRPRVGPHAD